MRRKIISLLTVLALLALIAAPGCAKKPAKKPAPTKKPMHVTAFYMEPGSGGSFASLERYYKHIQYFSPLWITVQGDGSLKDVTDPKTLKFARSKGIKIVPLVNIANSNDTVLTTPAIRDKSIINLIAKLKQYNYDGYNIDFEFIPKGTKNFVEDKTLLTKYMSILREKIKPMGKILNMSVIPHYQVSTDVSGIYDYSALAPIVDVVTLMLYDRHQAGSPPGPVSPLKWAETNIETAIKQGFKPNQICVGVATYGYDWPTNSTGGFSRPTKEIQSEAQKKGIQIKWSDQYQEPYYLYHDPTSGTTREVWFETHQTLSQKIDLAYKHGLHGICIWRLGFETPSFWDVVAKKMK